MRPVEALKKIMPNCRAEYVQAFESGDHLFRAYEVVTPRRLAMFIGQFGAETGGGSILYENMNYSADRLMQVFGANHSAKIVTRAEANELAHNPQAIAERVYGLGNPRKAKELGNTKTGDGYKYRGSGILQTTGGYNFKKAGEKVGVDFYTYPAAIVSPEHALKPALWEWGHSKCNALADRNDLLGISRAINLGNSNSTATPNGMEHRKEWTDRAWKVLQGQSITLKNGGEALPVEPPAPLPPSPVVAPPLPKPVTPAPPAQKSPAVIAGSIGAAGIGAAASQVTTWTPGMIAGVAFAVLVVGAVVVYLLRRN